MRSSHRSPGWPEWVNPGAGLGPAWFGSRKPHQGTVGLSPGRSVSSRSSRYQWWRGRTTRSPQEPVDRNHQAVCSCRPCPSHEELAACGVVEVATALVAFRKLDYVAGICSRANSSSVAHSIRFPSSRLDLRRAVRFMLSMAVSPSCRFSRRGFVTGKATPPFFYFHTCRLYLSRISSLAATLNPDCRFRNRTARSILPF